MTKIPNVTFKQNGSPYSHQFNDIYFDSESGYQQSQHVFIQRNFFQDNLSHGNTAQCSTLYNKLKQSSSTVTIAETGFGTGLNFLLTLQAYQKLQQQSPNKQLAKLNFISVEKFPLTSAQLAKSLQALPQLKSLADLLLAQYPVLPFERHSEINQAQLVDLKANKNVNKNEFNAQFFNGKITLQVIFDDATQSLTSLKSSKTGLVDAWYLDGFSPAKNPDMWHAELFKQIGRLSKPQATIATFTVAGFVKRHLQQVGFRMEKKSNIGNKEHYLTGVFQQNPNSLKGYQLRSKITKPQHVSIIGGGIASACAAYALTQKGIKVTLYCKDNSLAQGASSNAIGALFPLLHQQKDDISLFYQHAFWRAKEIYNQVISDGFNFAHQWCGLLDLSYKESLITRQEKFTALGTWPRELIHSIDAKQATKIANITVEHGGLFMPNAGWLAPKEAVNQLINAAKATGQLRVENNTEILKIKQVKQVKENKQVTSWQLVSSKETFNASVLIMCGGAEAIEFDYIKQLPFSVVQGQITSMQTNANINGLSTVICHKGYLTPQHNNIHCIGATFNKGSTCTKPTAADDQFNLTMLEKCLPELSKKINWSTNNIHLSKARLRCMTPDHIPMVGPMPDIQRHIEMYPHLAKDKNWKYNQPAPVIDNLYIMMGFGARGLCSAPLAADILVADLCGTPYPVDNEMLFNLSPNRFVIRDIIRRKIS